MRFLSLALSCIPSLLCAQSIPFPGPGMPSTPPAPTVIFLTSGTTWAVPANWNSANNKIECIGGGGGGQNGFASTQSGGGGGGAAYSKAVNVTLTPSSTVGIAVGGGG